MTVVFGWTSPDEKEGLLGADDLEGNSKARREKVVLVFDRWAVACTGSDTLHEASMYAAYLSEDTVLRDGSTYKAPSTLEQYLEVIVRLLPPLAEKRWSNVAEDEKPSRAKQSAGSLIFLVGGTAPTLHLARFDSVYPPKLSYPTPNLERLESGKVHRFGVNDPHPAAPFDHVALRTPYKWLRAQVKAIEDEVQAAVRAGDLIPPVPGRLIGDVGACLRVKGSKWKRWSSYASPEDALRELLK